MYYVRLLLLISVVGMCLPLQAQQTKLSICLEQGKGEYLARDYTRAQNTFERCLRMDPYNSDTLLSLGGVCLTQDKLDAAKNYFQQALQYFKRTSPYWSYTYSMLGDIALKQNDNLAALDYYNKSLQYNRANVNSLVGKGVIIENFGNQKEAADVYQTALAVEPLNLIARKRLIGLEPVYFNDEERLEALKQRYAVLPDKEELSDTDRELFEKIHKAEQEGGIDYLKGKYTLLPADFTATLFKDTHFEREVLTLSGYQAMQKQVAQDAIVVFQKAGVPLKDVFDLRDLRGNKIFLEDSTLTESGMQIYRDALNGKRMFLMPDEDVPPTQAHLNRVAQRAKEKEQKGYTEISRAELAVLKQQTNCSEETLQKHLGLSILPVTKNEKRYFVFSRPVTNVRANLSWYYVALYRARRGANVEVPANALADRYRRMGQKMCVAADGDLIER